ncbi:hypothetical protein TV39_01130 [Arthrobacter sp. SPG23]|uniref:hypothetical protein n=1 Tax=Arthrobacter sp. SPG23 TaxID=1610703 RepID=UPI0005BD0CF0|nr:hypothetical protein [Arthrobacter sp. SPG23]KIS29167.1 hypothetical protein TV39_01130 [Arthrobacter sp. SPG23]
MKAKLLFGTGMAAGFVLGSRSGRAAYEKIKARAAAFWDSKPVQDKVAAATEAVKEKAPEVSDQLTEAARRAGTVITSAVHRDKATDSTKGSTAASGVPTAEGELPAGDYVPSHSTHPETVNLGTADSGTAGSSTEGSTAATGIPDTTSDPALNDSTGQDWSDEGGATPAGAATNTNPERT